MRRILLRKHCTMLLLAVVAAAWSIPAWADVTINVKAPSAPHMYVWNSSQTPLNGAWPGDVVTDTKVVNGETYYTKTISNENTVSVIFAKDNDTQTGDFSGLTGEVFFHYNGETLAYGDLPNNAVYEPSGDFLYFVNSKNWSTVNCHVFNGNSTSTEAMNYIGTDKAGQKVYKWGPKSNLGFVPTNVIFNNGSWASQGGVETPSHSYSNGGYYVYSETNNGSNKRLDLVAVIDASRITNSETYFSDTHFREAITKSLGVAEGAAFTPTDYTIIDLSYDSGSMTGKISNLSGIEHFTNLEELDISNNSIAYGDITALTKLRKIVASCNPGLKGFGINAASSSNPVLRINSSSVLEYVDVSNTAAYYLSALNNNCSSTLKTLIVANNPTYDYSYFNNCTLLEHIDFSNCGLTSNALSSTYINCPNLEYLDCSGNRNLTSAGVYLTDKSKLKYFDMSGCDATPATTVANLANAKSSLEYLDLSDNNMSANGNDPALDGFTALQTFKFNTQANWTKSLSVKNCPVLTHIDVNGNVKMTGLTIDNCPSLQEVIITNSTSLPLLSITNSSLTTLPAITDLTTATALTKIDLTGNAFTAVPTVGGNVTIMVLNNNQLADIIAPGNIHYLYAQNNNLGSGTYTLPPTSLVGLDLGNNGFTKFKAEDNTSLMSLALSPNNALTEIELHGNTALTQTSPDGVIESNNGLYIKGLSSLLTLNIENSSFNKLGQQNSLEGCTGLTKLQARHNEFTTFTNGVYALDVAGTGNYRKPDNSESSLEHLVSLEYLDLAYNNLQDSVHLYRNVALKHLDVSHNNEIHGVIDGTITADNTAAQEAMRTKKAKRLVKYGMYYGEKGELTDALYAQACADQAGRQALFDIRYEDLNDTTGIYHLDLQKNVNLEWIDISYTNIHNTAAGPGVMNPGWMSRDWVGDSDEALAATVHANTTTQRSYSAFHTFVYFAPCSELKTIHMDHCNMQSLGVSYFPKLDTLTCSYMYGDCAFMRDATKTDLRYGMANTGPGRVRKYLSPKTNTETGIQDAVNVVGPDGTANTYYDNNIKYYDISYSGFNELRFNYGINLQHINVSGNPLKFHVHPNSDYSYYNSLDVTYCPNIRTVIADNCSDLPTVRAYNLASLDTLKLDNDPLLKTVYMQNNLAMNHFTGLSSLSGLETLFAYNNTQFGGIDVSNNAALKNLWVSNIGASAIDVSHNTALEKLRVYDNSLQALDVASNPALTWLDLARNQVPSMDLSANAALQYFNCSNSEETLNDPSLTANNHNGAEGDNVKPVSGTAQASNGGNSLSDLVFYSNIGDVRACYNDLHCIKPGTDRSSSGSFANLTNIEFAHNHINGIDLSAATNPTVNSEDNGRTILADCAKFTPHGDFGNVVTVYFFQLEDVQNGTLLTLKTCEDSKGATRVLGTDGLVLDNINWNQGNSAVLPKNVTLDPSNMGDYLDPDDVPGTIVVLEAANETGNGADGRATYTYDNGAGTSTFYLDWSSDGTITGITSVIGEDGFDLAGTYGGIVVAGKDGTVVGVYDLNGRQIASETISGGKLTIDGLAPGIYIVNGNKVLVQ